MDKITLYYFNVGDRVTNARGENVKLLLEDAGLNHNYIRLPRGEVWAAKKAQLIDEGFLSPTLPYIEIGDKKYGKAIPIMQYISAKLGNKYHGSDAEEDHYLAYVAEVTTEWYECLRTSFFGTDQDKEHHTKNITPHYIDLFEKFYAKHNGPYVLGDNITYPDFLIYHLLDDDLALCRLAGSPNLQKFVETFGNRPNIKKYFATLPKLSSK
ncbi:glutathione S-transferase [Mucor mucedo]|uniref:glutathione S-transferase n=1 Tax=Mucor mucedo TaxID=29922 RepID=UPI00222030B9|nr:glutathione S-transferase [Mucor mucedo]KAI7892886.1 glutathione S-transferase [Mucor mucedo]